MTASAASGASADVVAVEQVIRRSAAHNDARRWAELAALYTDDATLVRPDGQHVVGRAAIETSYAGASPTRRTRHLCGGTVVDLDGDVATATTPVLLFTWEDGSAAATGPAIGEFADVLVRGEDGWRLRERVATVSARVPAAGG